MSFPLLLIDLKYLLAAALLLLLAILMYKKRLHRMVPLFFAYLLYASISMTVIEILGYLPSPYWSWYASWIDEGICLAIEFAILGEVFRQIFAPFDGIRRFAKVVVVWSGALLVFAGVMSAILFHKVSYTVPVLTVVLVVDRSLRIVQLGVILCLFTLTKYLHLRWKNLIFGIALGFGFYAMMMLASRVVRMFYGRSIAYTVTLLEGVVYIAAILIWFSYTLQREVTSIPVVSLASQDLERWDRALAQLLNRTPSSTIAAASE